MPKAKSPAKAPAKKLPKAGKVAQANAEAANEIVASQERYRSRIVRHENVDPRTLTPNVENWRKHPDYQKANVDETLQAIGWIQDIIVNETTGNLIDGHLRLSLALSHKQASVPVKYVSLSREEERLALATFDPLGAMAQTDNAKFAQLQKKLGKASEQLEGFQRESAERAAEVVQRLAVVADEASKAVSRTQVPNAIPEQRFNVYQTRRTPNDETAIDDPEPVELPGIVDLPDYVEFEHGQTPFDIPQLRSDMLAELPDMPLDVWTVPDTAKPDHHYLVPFGNGNVRPVPWKQATICTFVEDSFLVPLWSSPANTTKRMLLRGVHSAITPDFTLAPSLPAANRLWNVYRREWVGRYWQEAGIRIIPCIETYNFDSDLAFYYVCISRKAPCLAIQINDVLNADDGSNDDEVDVLRNRMKRTMVVIERDLKPESLLLYGNPSTVEKVMDHVRIPKSLTIVACESYAHKRLKIERMGRSD